MKQGDVGTELVCTITDEAGAAIDLSLVSSVTLVMLLAQERLERSCAIDISSGVAKYTLAEGDLNQSGTLAMQWVVRFIDGDTYHSKVITERVEPAL